MWDTAWVRALITGITGQDGSYLAEQLAASGWDVFGLIRGQANPKEPWIRKLVPSLRLIGGDVTDAASLYYAVEEAQPDVVFNLAAMGPGLSWSQPDLVMQVCGLGVVRLLEAVRQVAPRARFVQASSAGIFGNAPAGMAAELTPFHPANPYATAKVYAHYLTVNYRESYDLHASTAIMFNHESPRSASQSVTRKISQAVAAIGFGEQEELVLGLLGARRDWGWAPEFTQALPLIAAQEEPGDYVLATGESHTVLEFCEKAFAVAGLDHGEYLRSDPALLRRSEIGELLGDPARARVRLGWEARVGFDEIVTRLVQHELAAHS